MCVCVCVDQISPKALELRPINWATHHHRSF